LANIVQSGQAKKEAALKRYVDILHSQDSPATDETDLTELAALLGKQPKDITADAMIVKKAYALAKAAGKYQALRAIAIEAKARLREHNQAAAARLKADNETRQELGCALEIADSAAAGSASYQNQFDDLRKVHPALLEPFGEMIYGSRDEEMKARAEAQWAANSEPIDEADAAKNQTKQDLIALDAARV
jgi:hypothetical protein